jgi:hypothetical protein
MEEITKSPYCYTYEIEGYIYVYRGMSLLPPPICDQLLTNYGKNPEIIPENVRMVDYIPPNYRTDMDIPLNFYVNIMEFLADRLGIGGGTHKIAGGFTGIEPSVTVTDNVESINTEDKGALLALLNPKIARLSWPCRDDIETFEEAVLIPYVEQITIENSQIEAENKIMTELGLTRAEAIDYIEVAKTYAREVHNFDPDRERSILVSKLQALATKCSDALQVTTELNANKTILQVLGLTKHEDEAITDKRAGLKTALDEKLSEAKVLPPAKENPLLTGD